MTGTSDITKDDLDLVGWIVMQNLGHVATNVREKVHTLFNLSFNTIDHSLEKLIKLGIIERSETDIDGIPATLYSMLPFNRQLDKNTAFREPEKGKRIFIIDEDFRRFLASTEDIATL